MTQHEARSHGVYLSDQHVGDLMHNGNVTKFMFTEEYWELEQRRVLGLWFENNPKESPQASMRLPSWFSNLLPEGKLREWIAREQNVSVEKEIDLLLRIGSDLPGAVVVRETSDSLDREFPSELPVPRSTPAVENDSVWKFSLAGVGMKFSMLQDQDRLVLPASDTLGNWIVKLPEQQFAEIPSNEAAMMSLAASVGIDIPEHRLIHRDELAQLPDAAWSSTEHLAYAVKRFDRDGARRIHIEDFAQVRGKLPLEKYEGSFETVAALSYRAHDLRALQEWARRMAFNVAVGNGDAHLKNWSLIYPNRTRATLSPAYDLVSTFAYVPNEDLGLKFTGTKLFDRIRSGGFADIERKLGVEHAGLEAIAAETISSIIEHVEEISERYSQVASTLRWIAGNAERVRTQLKL